MDPHGRKVPPVRSEPGVQAPVAVRQVARKSVVRLIQVAPAVRPRPPFLGVRLVPKVVPPSLVAAGAMAPRAEVAVSHVGPTAPPPVRRPGERATGRSSVQEIVVRGLTPRATRAAGEAVTP